MKKTAIFWLLAALLIPMGSCAPAIDEPVPQTGSESPPPVEKSLQEQMNELAEKYKDDPEKFDAAVYALHEGVTVEEAVRRFELMDEAHLLGNALEENEADTLAGFWIQHEPNFCLVAAFTRNGEETLEKYREDYPGLVAITEVREMKYTQAELLAAQQEAMSLLNELGLFFSSGTMIMDNRVEIYITDSRLFYSRLEESGKTLLECVVPVIVYEPREGVPGGLVPDPSVHFPQLATASSVHMTALMTGTLELVDGYLRVHDSLIIWQPDFYVHNNNGTIEIWDKDGKVVGRVGEEIYMGGGGGGSLKNINQQLLEPLPEDTEGPFWMQGGGTRLNLNFNSDYFNLHVITDGENKAFFLTGKPALNEMAQQKITLTGSWKASYPQGIIPYPQFVTEPKPIERKGSVSYTTFWPAGYTARITDGVFEVLDGQGKIVVRDGEEISITGTTMSGYIGVLHDDLPGGYSGPYLVVEEVR